MHRVRVLKLREQVLFQFLLLSNKVPGPEAETITPYGLLGSVPQGSRSGSTGFSIQISESYS